MNNSILVTGLLLIATFLFLVTGFLADPKRDSSALENWKTLQSALAKTEHKK